MDNILTLTLPLTLTLTLTIHLTLTQNLTPVTSQNSKENFFLSAQTYVRKSLSLYLCLSLTHSLTQ